MTSKLFCILVIATLCGNNAKTYKKLHHRQMNTSTAQYVSLFKPTSRVVQRASIHKPIRSPFKKIVEGSKRSVLTTFSSEFPESNTKEMIKKYQEMVKAAISTNSDDDSEFDNVKDKFMDVLEIVTKSGGDLFKLVEDKMGISPSSNGEITIATAKEFINKLASGNEDLDKSKWIKLKELKKTFLPQDQEQKKQEYTKDFFPDWIAYILTFVAGTLDMILTGDVDKCQFSRELDILKFETETAVEALIYRRLSMLEPVSNSWAYVSGNNRMNWNDKYTEKTLCEGAGCILKNGDDFPVEESIKDVGKTVLEDAKDMFDVIDEILKHVATNGKLCFKDCDCPEEEEVKIERVKYTVDFPWGCRGKRKRSRKSDKERECVLPCGSYGKSYDWCPVELTEKRGDWDYCTPANWEECVLGWF